MTKKRILSVLIAVVFTLSFGTSAFAALVYDGSITPLNPVAVFNLRK